MRGDEGEMMLILSEGQVLYSFSNISENSRWPILRTVTGKIKGTFAPKAIALFQNATHELGFDYSSPDVVYMVYPSYISSLALFLYLLLPVYLFYYFHLSNKDIISLHRKY